MKTQRRTTGKANRLLRVRIREERVVGFATLPTGKPRVDREAGVIYGVKVVGRRSPNKHGVEGADDGTEYTMEALEGALHLYDGINCNIDHPPRKEPGKERSAHDRFAWIENPEVMEAGIFGELHFLDPTDPLAVKMFNAAERKPDAFALSHNAWGRGEVRNGRYVITEIPEVRSVDIVADGGTNRSLFEGREMTTTVAALLREHKTTKSRKKAIYAILEADEFDEMPMEEADETGDELGKDEHLANAMTAVIKDANLSPAEKKKQINKMLAMLDEGDSGDTEIPADFEGEEDEEENLEESEEDEEAKLKEGCEDEDDKKNLKESREAKQRKARKESRERLCKLAGFDADADLLEGLVSMDTATATRHLLWLKNQRDKDSRSGRPRSQSPGARTPVQENADHGIPIKAEEQLAWLRN